ncbi:FAD/NAD(P)-binding protein [Staphylococcus chromogenes]|nr:FAD/NAD(P)-binding protein [Staphylococcus chromogenes]
MRSVAIVGIGPRGISIIDRIAAEAPSEPFELHLIEETQIGAGRVWLTEQNRELCMNTLAGAVTLFTEPGATVVGPVRQGPTMYEWIQYLRGDQDAPYYSVYATLPPQLEGFDEELASTGPGANPSRALYGAYLRWVYLLSLQDLPQTVTVHHHAARAVSIVPSSSGTAEERDRIELDDGTSIEADATVLALGWLPPARTSAEEEIAALANRFSLHWVEPGNPIEQDLSQVPAGEDVLVRGLGMGFFDIMALLTVGRGGSFEPQETGQLRYKASGAEPRLLVTSGRGYPYLPKAEYPGLPPVAEMPHFKAAYERLLGRDSINFSEEILPAIIADAHLADPTFDIERWYHPQGNAPVEDLPALVAEDLRHAELATHSPLKNALWVVNSARKPVSILGAGGRYTDKQAVSRFMAMGQMIGSGPPAFRTRQLLALIEAGVVKLLGASDELTASEQGWQIAGHTARTLIDAFMHKVDWRSPADTLVDSLAARSRPYRGSGSPETDPATRQLVHPDGSLDPRVALVGIPTYAQHPDTTISPMPGTDPLFLQETDKAAQFVLARIRSRI